MFLLFECVPLVFLYIFQKVERRACTTFCMTAGPELQKKKKEATPPFNSRCADFFPSHRRSSTGEARPCGRGATSPACQILENR